MWLTSLSLAPARRQKGPAEERLRATRGAAVWLGLVAMVTGILAAGYVLITPTLPHAGLDISWALYLNEAALTGKHFGTDVVFTFGPYGYLYTKTPPPALAASWYLWRLFLFATLAVGCVGWWHRGCASKRGVVLVAVLLAALGLSEFGYFLAAAMLAFAISGKSDEGRFDTCIVAVGLALASLIKFSWFLAAAAVLAPLTFEQVLRHRRAPLELMTWLGSVAVFWMAAGESLVDFPHYVDLSWEVSRGYCEAMSVWRPTPRLMEDYLLIATPAMLMLGVVVSIHRRQGPWLLAPAVATAGLAFVIFKAGVVRHDGHELLAQAGMAALVALGALPLWRPSENRRVRAAIALALLVSICPLIRYGMLPRVGHAIASLDANVRYLNQLRRTPGRAIEAWEQANAEIRDAAPLPPMPGTVDIYPVDLAVPLAHGLKISNRPVIQSYSAYTPRLAQLNADHLSSERAADHLIFHWPAPLVTGAIDGRLPLMEDSLSWPEILTRYDSRILTKHTLVLDKRTRPLSRQLDLLEERTIAVGEEFEIPVLDGGPLLWAELHLEPTWLHSLHTLLHKDVITTMHVRVNGKPFEYRILPSLAASGFLLQPFVQTIEDLEMLARYRHGKRLESFRIETDARVYQPELKIKLYQLRIE